jgi:polar amino acid transport system permease protein
MDTAVTTPSTAPPEIRGPTAPLPLGILALGAVSLALAVFGPIVVIALHGFTPYEQIVVALKSDATAIVLITAMVLAAMATAVGFAVYRRMPTRRMRDHAIAGAFLGVHALTVGLFLLWFRTGEVEIFVRNFLNFEVLSGSLPFFLRGAKNTIILALVAEVAGIVLGMILAILALSHRRVVRAPARAYINFFRGTPLLWQLTFMGFGISLGLRVHLSPFQIGALVLTLNASAYVAEIFRAGIQSIERGQLEAARSLGMSYFQAMRYSIVPQAFRRVIPPLMNEFVALIKDTSLVSVLGVTLADRELLSVAQAGFSESFNATYFVAAALGYLAITLPLIRAVNWLESKLRSGLVGVAG